ncbi:MAG TPA: archaemetzincin family Zn-dependent metalloprotease [Lentimicrobium sp.]|nr:archaemetzincin family Zn-dependent metalloprotease [Lentimicrobium sp.]
MGPDHITLISFGYPGKNMPEHILRDVEAEFRLPVIAKDGFLDIEEYFDQVRGQYNANKLLHRIEEQFSADNEKVVAIFGIDLFIPILTYIFGQAFLNGKVAVTSTYRLGNERYGLPKNDAIFIERFKKEVIHELGHTFGLIHCFDPVCVMRSSTYVEEIDQKEHKFCQNCRNELLKAI